MPNARLAQRLYEADDISRLTQNLPQQAWLFDRASLTEKLQARCPTLQVVPLYEGWGHPYPFEEAALARTFAGSTSDSASRLPSGSRVWIREVILECQGQAWIFARSVSPAVGARQPWAFLRQQGQQPLGQRLFQDPSIERDAFLFSRWHWPSPAIAHKIAHQPMLARHCLYQKHQAPLLLSEIFLADFWSKKTPN
jgi:chorismate--pyruvate lyase